MPKANEYIVVAPETTFDLSNSDEQVTIVSAVADSIPLILGLSISSDTPQIITFWSNGTLIRKYHIPGGTPAEIYAPDYLIPGKSGYSIAIQCSSETHDTSLTVRYGYA